MEHIRMSEVLLHGHHEGLLTWGRGYDERLKEIRRIKPASEWPLREARMLGLTEAELDALPVEVTEACRAYVEALRACDEALRAYDEAGQVYGEARLAYDEAWRVYDEARRVYGTAVNKHAPALESWHRAVCVPKCKATGGNKWNIFG